MRKMTLLFVLCSFVLSCIVPPQGLAQTLTAVGLMPQPGTPVALTSAFTPAYLKGMVINPNDPFKFDFIIYRGDEPIQGEEKQVEYSKLIKYFLASLAVPDTDQWVNLSPYEQDRIIPDNFGLTEMGRDLLAQDYMLKQISASLSNPDTALGKAFWDEVYAQAYQKFGTTNVPTDTFNKVWIVPDKAVVYEKGNMVYVLEHHLKVMMESDYVAMSHQKSMAEPPATAGDKVMKESGAAVSSNADSEAVKLSKKVMREVIIPAIEKEVNEGRNFAPVRQVYSGMLLASWYKLALKESILGKLYADRGKVKGVDQDPKNNQEIYDQYVQAFKKGVFNMIKEDVDSYSQEVIPRKYFSGGAGKLGFYSGMDGILGTADDGLQVHRNNPAVDQRVQKEASQDDLAQAVVRNAGLGGGNSLILAYRKIIERMRQGTLVQGQGTRYQEAANALIAHVKRGQKLADRNKKILQSEKLLDKEGNMFQFVREAVNSIDAAMSDLSAEERTVANRIQALLTGGDQDESAAATALIGVAKGTLQAVPESRQAVLKGYGLLDENGNLSEVIIKAAGSIDAAMTAWFKEEAAVLERLRGFFPADSVVLDGIKDFKGLIEYIDSKLASVPDGEVKERLKLIQSKVQADRSLQYLAPFIVLANMDRKKGKDAAMSGMEEEAAVLKSLRGFFPADSAVLDGIKDIKGLIGYVDGKLASVESGEVKESLELIKNKLEADKALQLLSPFFVLATMDRKKGKDAAMLDGVTLNNGTQVPFALAQAVVAYLAELPDLSKVPEGVLEAKMAAQFPGLLSQGYSKDAGGLALDIQARSIQNGHLVNPMSATEGTALLEGQLFRLPGPSVLKPAARPSLELLPTLSSGGDRAMAIGQRLLLYGLLTVGPLQYYGCTGKAPEPSDITVELTAVGDLSEPRIFRSKLDSLQYQLVRHQKAMSQYNRLLKKYNKELLDVRARLDKDQYNLDLMREYERRVREIKVYQDGYEQLFSQYNQVKAQVDSIENSIGIAKDGNKEQGDRAMEQAKEFKLGADSITYKEDFNRIKKINIIGADGQTVDSIVKIKEVFYSANADKRKIEPYQPSEVAGLLRYSIQDGQLQIELLKPEQSVTLFVSDAAMSNGHTLSKSSLQMSAEELIEAAIQAVPFLPELENKVGKSVTVSSDEYDVGGQGEGPYGFSIISGTLEAVNVTPGDNGNSLQISLVIDGKSISWPAALQADKWSLSGLSHPVRVEEVPGEYQVKEPEGPIAALEGSGIEADKVSQLGQARQQLVSFLNGLNADQRLRLAQGAQTALARLASLEPVSTRLTNVTLQRLFLGGDSAAAKEQGSVLQAYLKVAGLTDPKDALIWAYQSTRASLDRRLNQEQAGNFMKGVESYLTDVSRALTVDRAEKVADTGYKGGIDFAQSNLDMQIKRDGKGVPLPVGQQDLENIHIDGLVPVILNIIPAAGSPVLSKILSAGDSAA
ncbi:MAG: hypothetical protein HGA80_03025 [Candidatus Omnitrophica bacterium]|nr:hypothetical protein [Candidatus Omnitrophota bacterium]